jgi:hypothetical protein
MRSKEKSHKMGPSIFNNYAPKTESYPRKSTRKSSSVNKVPSNQTGTAKHFPLLESLSPIATKTSKAVCLSGSRPNRSANSVFKKLCVLPVSASKITRAFWMVPTMRIICGVCTPEIVWREIFGILSSSSSQLSRAPSSLGSSLPSS